MSYKKGDSAAPTPLMTGSGAGVTPKQSALKSGLTPRMAEREKEKTATFAAGTKDNEKSAGNSSSDDDFDLILPDPATTDGNEKEFVTATLDNSDEKGAPSAGGEKKL
jgi:hypothetical protein